MIIKMADKTRSEKTSNTGFTWSDDELELLLECALQYKSTCEFEGISWESTRAKYEKIKDIIRDRYPVEEGRESEKRRDGITKERIAAKIKKIRADYKKAVDAGRRSGGGRVVLTFYNLCENLWGGSPSVLSVENGLDSSADQTSETATDATPSTVHSDTEIEEPLSAIDTGLGDYFMDDNDAGSSTTCLDDLELSSSSFSRREKIAKFLQNRKDKKMNHRLSNEAQMLSIAKEDVALKRKMIERMGKFDLEFNASVSKVSKTMEEMGETFRQTMGLLANALNPITPAPKSSSSKEKDIH